MAQSKRPIGLTKHTGFQVGARRTLPVSLQEAWDLVTSQKGIRAWLGGSPKASLLPGETYRLRDGTIGSVRLVSPGSHLRITWHPSGWERPSLIQVRVIRAATGTTISFHQEHLPDTRSREQRRAHFSAALDKLERLARRA